MKRNKPVSILCRNIKQSQIAEKNSAGMYILWLNRILKTTLYFFAMEKETIITEFKKRRTRQYIVAAILLPVFLLLIFVGENPDSDALSSYRDVIIFSLLGIVICLVGFSFWNWRCPSCKKYLGKGINPGFCSNCGARLR